MTALSPPDLLAYFFCQFDNARSLSAREIVGSLARQLLVHLQPVIFQKVASLHDRTKPDIDQILGILHDLLQPNKQYYLVVDGLDDCDNREVKMFYEAVRHFLAWSGIKFKIYFSSRTGLYHVISIFLRPDWHIPINGSVLKSDIESFITVTLTERVNRKELQLGDPNLELTIRDFLIDRAQGM